MSREFAFYKKATIRQRFSVIKSNNTLYRFHFPLDKEHSHGKTFLCKFINCRFDQCTIISLKSKYSEIKNAVFHKCNLVGIHWHTLLPSGKYPYAVNALENCCIKYNTFTEMNFTKFNFSDSIILESLFENCNLTECNFKNCRLEGTQFFKCNLQKADFRDAKGYVIDIHNNQMKAARFSFPDVIRLLETLNIKIE